MRRGFIILGEEFLSLLAAFLAFMLLLSNFIILNKRSSSILNERMQLVADNIADTIAKKYVDSEGNVDPNKLNVTLRDKIEVRFGTAHFGGNSPDNVNVYSARRLVFVNGQPLLMEVKVWP